MSCRLGLRQRRRLDACIYKWHKLWLFIDTDHSCANTNPDANADTNTHTNTNAHTDTNTNAHTDTNSYTNTNAHTDTNTYSYPHTYSYAGGQKRKAWDCL